MGRTLQNMVTIGVQAVVLVLVALPFGLRASWSGIVSTVILICLLALGISAASYAMGLILKDEDAFAPFIQGVSLPLLLLSGVLLPMSLAPAWLRHTSAGEPADLRRRRQPGAVPRRLRRLARVDRRGGDASALGALLAWWGTRTFQRQSA